MGIDTVARVGQADLRWWLDLAPTAGVDLRQDLRRDSTALLRRARAVASRRPRVPSRRPRAASSGNVSEARKAQPGLLHGVLGLRVGPEHPLRQHHEPPTFRFELPRQSCVVTHCYRPRPVSVMGVTSPKGLT